MGFSNSSSLPRPDRLLLLVFSLASALLYLGYAGNDVNGPRYPPGTLPPDARGGGAGSCRMTFMSPSYFHLEGFNKNETRLGDGPWGLYLYREAGWDDDPIQSNGGEGEEKLELTGTPVLFVPGNAGSFKQVRSLASTATRTFWELPGLRREGAEWDKEGSTSLDFFTLDFNDDFSAFHGQTLFDQAEYTADAIRYILSLYPGQDGLKTKPTSLIVVAHSMGGIVARATFLDSHYLPDSISTLITFATPHLVPPVTVDSGVDSFYSSVNSYWREAYGLTPHTSIKSPKIPTRQDLQEVVTISVNGGISDEMIASETASLSSLVPEDDSNGFSVSTTAIPGVQTPMDHLAILWCQQLMQVVAESILTIVDSRNSGTISRQARVDVFSTRLLGGLERKSHDVDSTETVNLEELERGTASRKLGAGERLNLRGGGRGRTTYLMPRPHHGTRSHFSLLTSATIGFDKQAKVQVYGCSSSSTAGAPLESISCTRVSRSHLTVLPSSPHNSLSPILPAAVGDETMNLITLDGEKSAQFDLMLVVVEESPDTWLLAEFADRTENIQAIDRGAFHLLVSGYQGKISTKKTSSFISEVSSLALQSSLLTLKLKVTRSPCHEKDSLFAPLLRQFSSNLHESKYYPNARTVSLYSHTTGPFLPPSSSANSGTRLQFFLDPTCGPEDDDDSSDLTYEISVDLLRTIGNLFVRYRMSLVTIPFALIMLVIAIQIYEFNSGNPFPPFDVAFSIFARQYLPSILGLLFALGYLQTILLDTSTSGKSFYHVSWISDALFGNSGSFWVPFFPLIVLASCALVIVEHLMLSLLVNGIAYAAGTLASKTRSANSMLSFDPLAPHLSSLQRTTALAFLLLVTIFFAPHQFAYLVLFAIHLLTTIRILVSTRQGKYTAINQTDADPRASTSVNPPSTASTDFWDRYHFSFSVLFLLLSLLPHNALILVVWVRNLAVGWFAPFSSDHQVFSILGFLALVESVHSGKMLQRVNTTSIFSRITTFLAFISAAYSLLYGIRTAHRIYTFGNIFAGWLALLTSGGRFLSTISERNSSTTPGSETSEGTTRKVATTTRNQD